MEWNILGIICESFIVFFSGIFLKKGHSQSFLFIFVFSSVDMNLNDLWMDHYLNA